MFGKLFSTPKNVMLRNKDIEALSCNTNEIVLRFSLPWINRSGVGIVPL